MKYVTSTWMASLVVACALSSAVAETPHDREVGLGTEPAVRYGMGFRSMLWMIPQSEIELFVEEAPGGKVLPAFMLEFVRQKGEVEVSFGVGYSSLEGKEGPYLGKGDDPAIRGEEPDFVEFDDFSWLVFEVLFTWHKPIHETLSLRYGAGLGFGVMLGEILQTDMRCTSREIESCTPITREEAGQLREPADVPPLMPVTNVLAGVQWKLVEQVVLNIEGGLRLIAPFVAVQASYFF